MKATAKLLITIGLFATICLGFSGSASAAPADRAGDAVVMRGEELPSFAGVPAERIVAFAFRKGSWKQVPLQVDERHTVDVRQLYPPGNFPPYVGNNDPDFDLEVYADPKTRSGADANPNLDTDDQISFMAGDTGLKVPAGAGAPEWTDPGSGTGIKVADPVGGGSAYLYLFRSLRPMDQSAGRDYVDYDFRLTNLTEGQTLLDNYSYIGGFNPEDSTVTTDNYSLHSVDRWMEDEMKITAGNANGTDILDREVAQATKLSCGRSEFTFSGRWQQDTWAGNNSSTDNEGTYIAVIDGPVRAIRSYMGANSGPYVQREHIYYRDHEQNTIFLRVHVMTDLYAWTDYAQSAIGMTYRDMKNTTGVTVDGQPDSLTPATTEDVANGAYGWQQVSGPQGTATTVVGSDTDIPNASFGTYYLDDSTPTAPDENQCGGDGQSIGASGFGILGPITPNTDPRLGEFNSLTVKRIRYFGPPSDGSGEAENYTARVSKPLGAAVFPKPMGLPRVALGARLLNRKVVARPGRNLKLRLRIRNTGFVPVVTAKVCAISSVFSTRKNCGRVGSIGIGKSRVLTLKPKVGQNAKGRKLAFSVSFEGQAEGSGFTGLGRGFAVRLRR